MDKRMPKDSRVGPGELYANLGRVLRATWESGAAHLMGIVTAVVGGMTALFLFGFFAPAAQSFYDHMLGRFRGNLLAEIVGWLLIAVAGFVAMTVLSISLFFILMLLSALFILQFAPLHSTLFDAKPQKARFLSALTFSFSRIPRAILVFIIFGALFSSISAATAVFGGLIGSDSESMTLAYGFVTMLIAGLICLPVPWYLVTADTVSDGINAAVHAFKTQWPILLAFQVLWTVLTTALHGLNEHSTAVDDNSLLALSVGLACLSAVVWWVSYAVMMTSIEDKNRARIGPKLTEELG